MVVCLPHCSNLNRICPPIIPKVPRSQIRSSMPSSSRPFLKFPHLSPAHRNLMLSVFSSIESRLGSALHPSSLPPDLQYFQSPTGSSKGALDIRSGTESSPVNIILGSWLHCDLPSGSSLSITTVVAFLKATTDAPHLVLEFIQSSPSSLILLMDLIPRKDITLNPEYLQTYYENTQLEKLRQKLAKLPEVKPFFLSSLYLRSLFSPTVILVSINCGSDKGSRSMEELMQEEVEVVAKQLVKIWLDECEDTNGRQMGEDEKGVLLKRDALIRSKTVELDLGPNMPRLFGEEIARRVIAAINAAYGV